MAKQSNRTVIAVAAPSSKADSQHFFEFLSLPLELRQKILNYSFSDAFLDDIKFNCNIDVIQHLAQSPKFYMKEHRPAALPHVAAHIATLLAIHPTIRNDLVFVIRQRLDIFDTIYKQYEDPEEPTREKRLARQQKCKAWASMLFHRPYKLWEAIQPYENRLELGWFWNEGLTMMTWLAAEAKFKTWMGDGCVGWLKDKGPILVNL